MNTRHLLLLAALMSLAVVRAQNQVSVTPVLVPPYSSYLSDYQGALTVNLVNLTGAPQQVKLIGSLTGDNGYSGYTRSTYQPAQPIQLAAFETRLLYANSPALSFIDRNNFQISAPSQIQDAVMQTGILPEGNYELCIQAVDYTTNAPLSPEAPIGCIFFTLSYAQPPVLTFPWCGENIATAWPVFTWSPPIGNFNLSNIRYDLYLLELLPGQNPTNALWLAIDGVAGNPITRKDLMVPSYPWQPYDPVLKANTTYAVGVVARDISNTIVIENKGRSEVCTFLIESGPTPITASVDGSTLATTVSVLPIGPIPDTRIKGRLVHVFKNSGREGCTDAMGPGMVSLMDGAVVVANVPIIAGPGSGTTGGGSASAQPMAGNLVMGAYNYFGGTGSTSQMDLGSSTLAGALEFANPFPTEKWIDRFPVSAVGGKPMKNIPIKLVERVVLEGVVSRDGNGIVTGETDRLVLGVDPVPGGGFGGLGQGNNWHQGQLVATGTTDSNGEFDLFYHQPSLTGLPVPGSIDYFINFDKYGQPAHQWNGSTTASRAYKVLMLEVVSPYYCSPDIELYPQPGDNLELPDQACYVRSYDLKVKVTQGACDQQMGGVGAAMGNVQVQVLRPTDHTTDDLPENEGQDLDESVNVPGMGTVPLVSTCASKSSDGSALFRNLVAHFQQVPDEYLVRCSTNNDRGLYTYYSWQKPYPNMDANGPIVTQWSHGDPGERRYLRNSGFEVKLWELPVALVPRSPRVIGRVMVSVTQPLQDATVKLRLYYDKAPGSVPPVVVGCDQSTQSYDFLYMEFTRKTDANGFFDFSNILVKGSQDGMSFLGPHASIVVSKPGYMSTIRPLASGNKPGTLPSPLNLSDPENPRVDLKMGLQWDMTSGLLLEPYGLASGNVVNENGTPVRCDVQVADGPWGRTETVFLATGGGGGGPGGWSEVQFTAQERFSVPGPPGFRPIKLIPLSDQYFPLTEQRNVPFNVSGTPSDLGTFVVKEKRHRLKVKLTSFDGPVAGAIVKVDDLQRTSDQAGIAFFEFLSPETEFRLKVDPPGDMMPVDRIIVNQVSPEPVVLEQMIETGTKLTGRVRAMPGDAPVANARVWMQIGSDQYGPQLNQVLSDENGEFILPGVPMGPFKVFAAKADPQTTYIGTSQAITYGMVPGPPPSFKMIPALPYAELTLQRVDDMDITHLLGFPVEVTTLVKNNDGSSTIGGAFVQLPGNANFRLEDPAQRIPFANVKVTPGTPNEQGKPIAFPANDRVTTDMTHVSLKLYTDLDVTLCGMPGRLFPGRVKVQGTPQGGEVLGTVSTELSSFNFSYDFSGRFYLGDGADQPLFDVFRSTALYPQRSFNLMTLNYTGNQWAPANARFSLRGFEAHSDRSRSVVEPDVFKIATVIEVKDVPDITPEVLQLDVGNIRVNATSIEGIQGGGQELSFELNDWTFKSTAPWVFDNSLAAIVIPKGILDMQLVKADMTQILIRPNGLDMKAQNLGEVRLGGVAPLVPEANAEWTFGYDPGYVLDGKTGVWRYGTLTGGNGTVATVQGPAELVPSKLQFSSFSLVSRGAPLAEVRAIKHRYYDIMDVTPVGSMQFTPDAVDLLVNCSMQIKGLPTTTGFFSFFKEGGKTVSRLKPLGATVTTGRGNVYFKMADHTGDQEIKPGQFTCYGKFRIDPEDGAAGDPVYAYGYLDHKLNNTYMDVIRVDAQNHMGNTRQEIRFGASLDKKMLLNSGRQTMASTQWNELAFKGNLLNMGGIDDAPENELSFVVKGAVALSDGKISMTQLNTPFGNMSMSYDFEHARLVGGTSISNVTFGAVNILQATVGMLVDKDGFLVSVPKSHVLVPAAPWPLQDHHPAFLLGAHNAIPDTLLTNMMKDFRLKTLPAHMAGKKISGIYLQNRLDLLDFSVPSINLLVLGVEGHASCKVEGRTWVDLSGSLGMGGMAYADLGMEFWLLSPIPNCSSANVSAGVEMLFEAAYQNSQLTMTACGSASASASICGVGDSVDLTVKGSVNSGGKITLARISGSCGQ
ncbi:MAG TPA: carboxypeptidase-like regulatory domain-containing protein [Flavobacteriales bacterium]|mgnify:FL=1|jgi:hypothetical protein|nr:carboxypeptidase-like regulatory domain-containing protein [Flavobacteriales bacterium]